MQRVTIPQPCDEEGKLLQAHGRGVAKKGHEPQPLPNSLLSGSRASGCLPPTHTHSAASTPYTSSASRAIFRLAQAKANQQGWMI